MTDKDGMPPGWKANIESLWSKLKVVRTFFFVGFLSLVVLNFTGYIPFWPILLFIMAVSVVVFRLLYIHIRCPNCSASPFSKAGLKSGDYCHNCGFKLNDRTDVKETVAAKYTDKRASNTDWSPLPTASANFDNYKLHLDKRGRLSFKATPGSLLFGGLFVAIGIAFYTIDYIASQGNSFVSLFALLFVAVGLFLSGSVMQPIRINENSGLFILGWRKENAVPLIEIEAVQLLERSVSGDRKNYPNYQLNLVLAGGQRRNVIYYYNRDKAVTAAGDLASTLGVKLWNGIDS